MSKTTGDLSVPTIGDINGAAVRLPGIRRLPGETGWESGTSKCWMEELRRDREESRKSCVGKA